jgi:hypothetical protein
MSDLSRQQLESAAQKLITFHGQAEKSNDWIFFVDEMYANNCIYTCEYGGALNVTANGIDEIKATHYGRDMQVGWEGWTFPYMGIYIGSENKIVNHWMNRGPGQKSDGSYYETPGISYITFNNESKICHQFDMFDIAHQMNLCDQLEAEGLLSAELKNNWVIPMKEKVISMLS